MGEYWKPINVSKKEFIHPHKFNCGLKLGEWTNKDSRVMQTIRKIVKSGRWSSSDDIRIVSDYGNELPFGAGALETDTVELAQDVNLYTLAEDEFTDISEEFGGRE